MDTIYVLRERSADYFGSGAKEWKHVGWTENPREAGAWSRSATRDINRDFVQVQKHVSGD